MTELALTHATADGADRALCGAGAPAGWARLFPIYVRDDITCAVCVSVMFQRYMAAVALSSSTEAV